VEGAAHTVAVQLPEMQSSPSVQCLPIAHSLHAPPQSTSVSVPSCVPLVQLAGGGGSPSPEHALNAGTQFASRHARHGAELWLTAHWLAQCCSPHSEDCA
jgi:hypothetical protein